jgi:hypothetical protein
VNRISESVFTEGTYDLSAKYVAAREIHGLLETAQSSLGAEDIAILASSLKDLTISKPPACGEDCHDTGFGQWIAS